MRGKACATEDCATASADTSWNTIARAPASLAQ
jgi:hypothetical protein